MEIILYAAGAAGDLVAATIDPTDYYLSDQHLKVTTIDRIRLRNKSGQRQLSDDEKEKYINASPYKSLPSHLVDFHIDRKHEFILVDSSDYEYAKWATDRFNRIYFNKLDWMTEPLCVSYHSEFAPKARLHTSRVILLKDILDGNLIKCLENLTDSELNDTIYKKWLLINKFR